MSRSSRTIRVYWTCVDLSGSSADVYITQEAVRTNRKPQKNPIRTLKDSTWPDSLTIPILIKPYFLNFSVKKKTLQIFNPGQNIIYQKQNQFVGKNINIADCDGYRCYLERMQLLYLFSRQLCLPYTLGFCSRACYCLKFYIDWQHVERVISLL